jgi:transcriptional regulator with XRE-family HTH domain
MNRQSKDRNWENIVNEIIDEMIISQSELAEICQVSQQAVSKWTKGESSPGKFAQRRLLKLLKQLKSIEDTVVKDEGYSYSINTQNKQIVFFDKSQEESYRKQKLRKLAGLADKLSLASVEKVLDFAEFFTLKEKQRKRPKKK